MQKTVLLVDPIHSFTYLSKSLKQYGVRSVAVFSDMSLISAFNRPGNHLFDRQIHLHSTDVNDIVASINEPIDFVLNGSDQHLALAEQLMEILTPSLANDINTINMRVSKYHQQQAMQEAGLPATAQWLFDQAHPDYASLQRLTYPVFAKPVNGGGSIGIFKAESADELEKKLKAAPKTVNFEPITHYLIQEYIDAKEVIIDVFSAAGQHYISQVYTYTKTFYRGAPIYRTLQPIEDQDQLEAIVTFCKKSLDACGYRTGFSHIELFQLDTQDFRLIELNPRISGLSGFANIMANTRGIKSQVDLLVAYLTGQTLQDSDFNRCKKYAIIACLYTHKPINFDDYQSEYEKIQISHTPLSSNITPDLTDLRQVVMLSNKDRHCLNAEINALLKQDVIA